jgi:hypothetical protein
METLTIKELVLQIVEEILSSEEALQEITFLKSKVYKSKGKPKERRYKQHFAPFAQTIPPNYAYGSHAVNKGPQARYQTPFSIVRPPQR